MQCTDFSSSSPPSCLFCLSSRKCSSRNTSMHTHTLLTHSDWLLDLKADPHFAGFTWLKSEQWGLGLAKSGTKSNICGVQSLSKTLLSEEAQSEHWGSRDRLKARPFIIVHQMKEPKCLFLPPISFPLPISPFWPLSFFHLSFPSWSFLPFVQIQWEWSSSSSLPSLVTELGLAELLGTGPTHAGALVLFFCVCHGVICQAAVAEVEPLRLKGYDPRTRDPTWAEAIIDLNLK